MLRHDVLSVALLGIIISAGTSVEARAQDGPEDKDKAGADWRLTEPRKGFCIQLLLDPAKLREVPDGVRLLPAEGYAELHPVLRRLVSTQPEYRSWSPSSLCFYYLTRVVGASESIGDDKDPAKAPVLAIWTVAGQTGKQVTFQIRRMGGRVVVTGAIDLTTVSVDRADFQLKMSFPGDVIDSNGEIDDSTVSWVFTPGEVGDLNAVVAYADPNAPSPLNWTLLMAGLVVVAAGAVVLVARRTRNPPISPTIR